MWWIYLKDIGWLKWRRQLLFVEFSMLKISRQYLPLSYLRKDSLKRKISCQYPCEKNDLLSPFIVTSLWMSHSKYAPNTRVFLWTVSFQKYIYRAFFCWNKRTNYDHVSKSNLRINILSVFVCDLIYLICINVNIVNKDWYCVFNPFKSKIPCLFVLTFSVNVDFSP